MTTLIFLITYGGIAMGRYPRLTLDRTGMAMLGALAMVLCGSISAETAMTSIHVPTLLLLYGLMIISAQLRLGGFYTWLAMRVTQWIDQPARFLFILMIVSGLLAAVLANDIICLAFTPVLAVALRRRRLNPLPFLLGLAMATNLGSAASMIGNPQSMLIGQIGNLSFRDFLFWCAPPSLACLAITFVLILLIFRNRLEMKPTQTVPFTEPDWPVFNGWQSAKGLAASAMAVILLLSGLPRELSVLALAGVLLLSRRMHTRTMLGLIDWHLITLFCGLFIVVRAFNQTGLPAQGLEWLTAQGLPISNPYWLSLASILLSNMVSNVPATVLIAPHLPVDQPEVWYVLSLATTYAGNLLTIGSMANLIVIEQAAPFGIRISFRDYARVGGVVTAANLAVLLGWIFLRSR
ncbi:MAG TPA: anion transporter [Verrucomicrobia bacterium]|nr:anion transporter [Verrucomicrobiota bacterium]